VGAVLIRAGLVGPERRAGPGPRRHDDMAVARPRRDRDVVTALVRVPDLEHGQPRELVVEGDRHLLAQPARDSGEDGAAPRSQRILDALILLAGEGEVSV